MKVTAVASVGCDCVEIPFSWYSGTGASLRTSAASEWHDRRGKKKEKNNFHLFGFGSDSLRQVLLMCGGQCQYLPTSQCSGCCSREMLLVL